MNRVSERIVSGSTDSTDAHCDKRLCQSIDWYAEGETRVVDVDGVRVTIRLVGRRGRRARIAITAPAGTVFVATEGEGRSGNGKPIRPR